MDKNIAFNNFIRFSPNKNSIVQFDTTTVYVTLRYASWVTVDKYSDTSRNKDGSDQSLNLSINFPIIYYTH